MAAIELLAVVRETGMEAGGAGNDLIGVGQRAFISVSKYPHVPFFTRSV